VKTCTPTAASHDIFRMGRSSDVRSHCRQEACSEKASQRKHAFAEQAANILCERTDAQICLATAEQAGNIECERTDAQMCVPTAARKHILQNMPKRRCALRSHYTE
jgi:hypothetical protein